VKPALFSSNSEGACPTCNGAGVIYTELGVMATVESSSYELVLFNANHGERPNVSAVLHHASADGLLLVRLLGVDTRTHVYTTMMPGPMYGPYYGPWWGPSMVAVPQVTQYDIAHVETSLFDVRTKRVIWAGTTQTFNPSTVAEETPGFADLIIGQLAARGLISSSK